MDEENGLYGSYKGKSPKKGVMVAVESQSVLLVIELFRMARHLGYGSKIIYLRFDLEESLPSYATQMINEGLPSYAEVGEIFPDISESMEGRALRAEKEFFYIHGKKDRGYFVVLHNYFSGSSKDKWLHPDHLIMHDCQRDESVMKDCSSYLVCRKNRIKNFMRYFIMILVGSCSVTY